VGWKQGERRRGGKRKRGGEREEGKEGKRDGTYSYMTILTASFKILSPKMTEYNLGSTLY
jgi:hypothetical protein